MIEIKASVKYLKTKTNYWIMKSEGKKNERSKKNNTKMR